MTRSKNGNSADNDPASNAGSLSAGGVPGTIYPEYQPDLLPASVPARVTATKTPNLLPVH